MPGLGDPSSFQVVAPFVPCAAGPTTPYGRRPTCSTLGAGRKVSQEVISVVRHSRYAQRHRVSCHEDRPMVHELPIGPHADLKSEPGGAPGQHVPVAAENECAHLLANAARATLHEYGLSDPEILELAEDFIAEDRGEDTVDFEGWAIYRHRAVAAPAV